MQYERGVSERNNFELSELYEIEHVPQLDRRGHVVKSRTLCRQVSKRSKTPTSTQMWHTRDIFLPKVALDYLLFGDTL